MMTTVPRYSPSVSAGAWLRWAWAGSTAAGADREANLAALGAGSGASSALELVNARQAIRVYLATLPSGEVLLPAQSCSVLSESVRRAGHEPRFLDADGILGTPSPEQYARAIGERTAAVILAPLYGYLQRDWQPLLDALGRRALLLDLAQGLGLVDTLDRALTRRADALVYSFGLGKGVDTGGGLLLTRNAVGGSLSRAGAGSHLAVFAQALAVRTADAAGVYRFLVGKVEEGSEEAKEAAASFEPRTLAPAIHRLWRAKLPHVQRELELARSRAEQLRAKFSGTAGEVLAGDAPLRQIVRLRDSARRDAAVTALRAAGVDCAPAGEPLPPRAPELYPNAAAFGASAIRLPFLGRLTEKRFAFVQRALESVLVDLSQ